MTLATSIGFGEVLKPKCFQLQIFLSNRSTVHELHECNIKLEFPIFIITSKITRAFDKVCLWSASKNSLISDWEMCIARYILKKNCRCLKVNFKIRHFMCNNLIDESGLRLSFAFRHLPTNARKVNANRRNKHNVCTVRSN